LFPEKNVTSCRLFDDETCIGSFATKRPAKKFLVMFKYLKQFHFYRFEIFSRGIPLDIARTKRIEKFLRNNWIILV
jgi:hypothetical protein